MKNLSPALWCFLLVFSGLSARAQSKDVLTYHDDVGRTGQYLVETTLTPANVKTNTFGKLWVLNVDGKVDAEPLYVSSLSLPGQGTHNVVIVVTEHDSVYAFDADSTNLFWHVTMLTNGESTANNGCSQVEPEVGITSTPVIDRSAGPNGTIFLVACASNGGTISHQVHALDLATGTNRIPATTVTASYPGNGANSSGGNVIFDSTKYEDRSALLLLNGIIYTTWASHCDGDPYTGWIMGYDENTLTQTRLLNVIPNGTRGAIWMAGDGPAADADGNFYFLDANGSFDTNLTAGGFPDQNDFGNGFLKISTSNSTIAVADYFEMSNTVSETTGDEDLGSGGEILLPGMLDTNGVTRYLGVGAGKDKTIYLVDTMNMGKFNPTNNNGIYQYVNGDLNGMVFSAPAYFNGTLYYGAVGDHLKAFPFQSARLMPLASESAISFSFPGSTPSISANGGSNGIVWATGTNSTAITILCAFNATNLADELYDSNQAGTRDHFGTDNKYITPMIANGKVYVATTTGVGVFGLLGQTGPEPVASMAYVQQPTNTLLGTVISPEVQVKAIGTNSLPDPGATITVSLNGTGTLGGMPAQVTDANGIAHFNDLTVNQSGPKSLTATASPGTASPTNSASFNIILPVAGLAFTTQPGNANAGAPFGQQPVLQTVDQNGTPTTAGLPATVFVNVAVSNATAALLGTTNYNIGTTGSNGVVQFSNLEIDTPGTGYQLIASSAGLPSNTVPGAVIWLDANNTASIATNASGVVSTWSNLGTRGASLGVAAGENGNAWTGPTFVGNSLNGKPVIRFSSTSTTQNPPGNVLTNTWPALDEGTDIQFFMAMRQPADPINNWGGYIGFGNSGAAAGKNNSSLREDTGWSSNGFRILRNDANTSPAYTNAGQFTLANYPGTGIGANFNETNLGAWYNQRPADGVAFVNAFYFHGSVNGGADYWADQNGDTWSNFQVSTVSYGDFNINDFGLGAQLGIGAGTPLDGPDWPMSVDIAEVLVYTNTMTDADRGTVFSYLQNKWLISGTSGSSLGSALSDPFNVQASAPPPKQITVVTVNANGSVTIGYATSSGFPYHVETTTNLATPWTTVPGSATNPAGNSVTFTDTTSAPTMARFYRVVSP